VEPNETCARDFLQFWFDGAQDGMIEIIATDASSGKPVIFRRFAKPNAAARWGCKVNRTSGVNVYFRAGTVTQTDPHRWTTDQDIGSAPGAWSDADSETAAMKTLEFQQASILVSTGNHPHPRQHLYAKTTRPLSVDEVRALNRRLAQALNSDPQVVNPSRMMRLPGSVAWPYKPGRITELVAIRVGSSWAPITVDALNAVLPPLQEGPGGEGANGAATADALLNPIRALLTGVHARDLPWWKSVRTLTAKLVRRGVPTAVIMALAEHLTWSPEYTVQETEKDLSKLIDGAVRKGWSGGNDQDAAADEEEGEDNGGDAQPDEDDGWGPQASAPKLDPTSVWDPWEDPSPPEWPVGALLPQFEDPLFQIGLRDGTDPGLLCTTAVITGSVASPKNSRFTPYLGADWQVPPILWLMFLGKVGLRKTPLYRVMFKAIRERERKVWASHRHAHDEWRRADKKKRGEEPRPPPNLTVNDYTPEALQDVLARTSRGTAIVKDELAGFFDFARYNRGGNNSARGFFLSAYEDEPYPVNRVERGSFYLDHTGISIFGSIQPDKLTQFAGLESDGLLQRFQVILIKTIIASQSISMPNLDRLHQAVDYLCNLDGRFYTNTGEGEERIRATEAEGLQFAGITDYGPGWNGYCLKLHGTHARLALVLHMLENPNEEIIPAATVHRAATLNRYLLQHAQIFYGAIPNNRIELLRDIGGWLLTKEPDGNALERIVPSDLVQAIRGCRPLGSKGVADVLDPFVTGGWLNPESNYPSNRVWFFNAAIRTIFQVKVIEERERRKSVRELIHKLGEPIS
jgi:hypothetical protein